MGRLIPSAIGRTSELELILNDLAVIEKRLERVEKDIGRMKDPGLEHERDLLVIAKEFIETERPLRELELEPEQSKRLRGFQFLSEKPVLLVLNLGESQASKLHETEEQYRQQWLSSRKNTAITAICGSIEAEIAELSDEEALPYLESYGLTESGLDRLIGATYSLLGRMSFLTASENEVRAWTIPCNTSAAKAAGTIHTDFEKKFIRAETIQWERLVEGRGVRRSPSRRGAAPRRERLHRARRRCLVDPPRIASGLGRSTAQPPGRREVKRRGFLTFAKHNDRLGLRQRAAHSQGGSTVAFVVRRRHIARLPP